MPDYRALVNGIDQQLLSKYPFEVVYKEVSLAPPHRFIRSQDKLGTLRQYALRVPGSGQKFAGLQELFAAYAKTPESKLNDDDCHFMPGLRGKMTTDAGLIQALVVNHGQVINKAINILDGKSLP